MSWRPGPDTMPREARSRLSRLKVFHEQKRHDNMPYSREEWLGFSGKEYMHAIMRVAYYPERALRWAYESQPVLGFLPRLA